MSDSGSFDDAMVPEVQVKKEPNIRTSKRGNTWYKQAFKLEWLEEEDFSGWLEPDPNDIHNSYCNVCDTKMVGANRSSLKRHSASVKHIRNLAKCRATGKRHQRHRHDPNYIENSYMESEQGTTNGVGEAVHVEEDDECTTFEVIPLDQGAPYVVKYPTQVEAELEEAPADDDDEDYKPNTSRPRRRRGTRKVEYQYYDDDDDGDYLPFKPKDKQISIFRNPLKSFNKRGSLKADRMLKQFKNNYGLSPIQISTLVPLLRSMFPDSSIASGLTSIGKPSRVDLGWPVPRMLHQVSKPAPSWEGTAVIDGQFKELKLEDFRGRYLVFFFYPLDFTFVCPTEILAFNDRIDEFHAINAEVVACSIDSHYTHLAWTKTPRKEGGLGNLDIPLLSDITHKISIDYGVFLEDQGIALRGLFIVDDKGILRQITMNDLPVGRSVDETLRLVQAFQFTDEHGEVCPAGWQPGDATIIPNPQEKLKYFHKANQ